MAMVCAACPEVFAGEHDSQCTPAILRLADGEAAKDVSACNSAAAKKLVDKLLVDVCAEYNNGLASLDDEESRPTSTTVSDAELGAIDSDDSDSCDAAPASPRDDVFSNASMVSSNASMATPTSLCEAPAGTQDSDSDVSDSSESSASRAAELGSCDSDTSSSSSSDVESPSSACANGVCAEEPPRAPASEATERAAPAACDGAVAPEAPTPVAFSHSETAIVFDWDDTICPSTWIQNEGMRLDSDFELSDWQREQLAQVAAAAISTLMAAKQFGTVVLITNAERGWIELSCTKFMPTLVPTLEGLKLVSARTSYEGADCVEPASWKIRAFDAELRRIFGPIAESEKRKNVLSLGDSIHEREALIHATSSLPNCRAKNMKFGARPSISELCKQHALVAGCFERIAHHDGNLDLCIRC